LRTLSHILLKLVVPYFSGFAVTIVDSGNMKIGHKSTILPGFGLAVGVLPVRSLWDPHLLTNFLSHRKAFRLGLDFSDIDWFMIASLFEEVFPNHLNILNHEGMREMITLSSLIS